MADQDFRGRGWAFPVATNASGGIALVTEDDIVKRGIRVVLGTTLGERDMRPDFGAGLDELPFEPLDAGAEDRAKFLVDNALRLWEPRVEVREVKATVQDQRLEIDVRYLDLETNREDNVVVPFHAGEFD